MRDPEMDAVNAALRMELYQFKHADETIRRKVVQVVYEVGALEWLVEICSQDPDPEMRDYVRLANELGASDD